MFLCKAHSQYLPVLELLALNAQTYQGSRDPDHAHFSKTLLNGVSGLSLWTRLANLKFVPLAILELLAFNTQNLLGHVTFEPIRTIFDTETENVTGKIDIPRNPRWR